MEAGQEVDPILSSYLKDNTQKRKSKRRSSVSSHEAMKMMKLATQHEYVLFKDLKNLLI